MNELDDEFLFVELLKIMGLISPAFFAYLASSGEWKFADHLIDINSQLLKINNSELYRLIINIPPRHGKSEFISKYFPAWYLTNNPNHRVLLTSYNDAFASLWCNKVKQVIERFSSKHYDIKISNIKNTKNEFGLEGYDGGLYCIGAGGSITGRGADLIIIDDPVKNDEEANSQNNRDKTWEWFKGTLFTRLEPNGKIIICMTRWHSDDLTGRISEEL